ncbi:hypothetical protein BH711_23055 [Pseudomonas fluorescens]|uniref:hypothetical protein n=1 Tax=Pseudomonas sp. Xaverov 259 TaxID=2666086 RepID=UPI00085399B6|nr:hypothetical protein [Pseudomonas sp. Xaverov 259]AOS76708.1 hypothetical protein BH711_23055 [Pseudomonas fluorescens]
MATLAASFSPTYQSFNTSTRTSIDPLIFDLKALVHWIASYSAEAFQSVQDFIEHLKGKCVEFYFRPTYGMSTPSATLGMAELHEALARAVYIEEIGKVLHDQAAARLRTLAACDYGWDGRDAEPMSIESLASLQEFFEKAGSFANDFGFFLGYEGEILISWTAKSGELIDMAFFDGRAELASDTEELEFAIDDPELYAALSSKY